MKIQIMVLLLVFGLGATGCMDSSANKTKVSMAEISQDHGFVDWYDETMLASAKNGKQKFVVFVSAVWCGPCVSQVKEMKANQDKIPAGSAILVADFDEDEALRETYGVTNKHTAIFFDEGGEFVELQSMASYADILKYLEG